MAGEYKNGAAPASWKQRRMIHWKIRRTAKRLGLAVDPFSLPLSMDEVSEIFTAFPVKKIGYRPAHGDQSRMVRRLAAYQVAIERAEKANPLSWYAQYLHLVDNYGDAEQGLCVRPWLEEDIEALWKQALDNGKTARKPERVAPPPEEEDPDFPSILEECEEAVNF